MINQIKSNLVGTILSSFHREICKCGVFFKYPVHSTKPEIETLVTMLLVRQYEMIATLTSLTLIDGQNTNHMTHS